MSYPLMSTRNSAKHRRKSARTRVEIVHGRAGRAGMIASICMAMVGVGLGAVAAYLGGQGNLVEARYSGFERYQVASKTTTSPQAPALRDHTIVTDTNKNRWGDILRDDTIRQKVVDDVLRDDAHAPQQNETSSERLQTNLVEEFETKPKVAIIFDDMGPDKKAFDQVNSLPGPLTLSFLPYANRLQALVEKAAAKGFGIMLHLPMEPLGTQDPGPRALKTSTPANKFARDLDWNLDRFTGFTGVNNHMGSKLTADRVRMNTILSALKERDVYFLDSVTTPNSVVSDVATLSGATVLRRDVFLDPQAGRETVRRQLQQVEEIARRTGYAIAIAHPHQDTIDVIGPWLTSATLRGFELVTVDSLVNARGQKPLLRLDG